MPFDAKGLDFLTENRLMNSREWYHQHKDVYTRHVLQPMQEFVSALAPTMLEIDPQFIVTPAVGRTISHINRDTRFTKDKSLYRANIWCVFIRDKKLYDGLPSFFFDVSPGGYSYGCGYYKASAASMELMREMILRDDPLWLAMQAAYNEQGVFALYGERYKKHRYPAEPPEKQRWLDLKNIGFEATGHDPELLYSGRITEVVREQFALLAPMYRFMIRAEEQRLDREQAKYEAARGARPEFDW